MPANASSFLTRAVGDARRLATTRERALPLDALRAAAAEAPRPRGFRAALRDRGDGRIAVIAEVKRRSPSKGPIRLDADAAALATAYERGGAAAVSVLTEPEHFAGSPDDLRAVRAAVGLPLLRKDFVTVPYQVWEARAWGADAVLLIVAALAEHALRSLLGEAEAAGLDALVEVHGAEEAELATAVGATLVGVNARNLATLDLDQGRFAEIRACLPAGAVVVAESGIRDRADVEAVEAAGADAVLVGESLVRADDPAAALAALRGAPSLAGTGEPRSRRWRP